jgi:hypothetical protein
MATMKEDHRFVLGNAKFCNALAFESVCKKVESNIPFTSPYL